MAIRHVRALSFHQVVLRSGLEESMIAFVAEICKEVGFATPQNSPKASNGSLGLVERAHLTVAGLSRTLLSVLSFRYGIELSVYHPTCEWVVRHCSWVHFTQAVNGADKMAAYQRRYGRQYGHAVVPFGETVLWKSPQAHRLKL